MDPNRPPEPAASEEVEYFQRLADGAPVMIWMSGADMGCFYFNRAWLDYRGRTTEDEFGNGWAEGVHPDDLERCVQHYVSSFQRRAPFAMSYRLQHHSGEFRWILDRGAPHFSAAGEFLGFFGGCAETPAEVALARLNHLRDALREMQTFAHRIAEKEANASREAEHAAKLIETLAADMLTYEKIENGACLR